MIALFGGLNGNRESRFETEAHSDGASELVDYSLEPPPGSEDQQFVPVTVGISRRSRFGSSCEKSVHDIFVCLLASPPEWKTRTS